MPIPLIPTITYSAAIKSALAAGGTLVPHGSGGLIVTGPGGYITDRHIFKYNRG